MKGTLSQLIEKLGQKQKAYKLTFAPGSPAHDAFVDLGRFCHAFHNELIPNKPELTERMAGRREAYMHIWQFLHLRPEELIGLYPQIVLSTGDE